MSGSNPNFVLKKMMYDAIGLIASYLSTQAVRIDEIPFGHSTTSIQNDDETIRFLNFLDARHALACGLRIRPILLAIERRISTASELARETSKGVIKGRFDVQRYINTRIKANYPRDYPILIKNDSPETPENSLVVQSLRGLMYELSKAPFPRSTAEGQTSLSLYNWFNSELHRWPWDSVRKISPIGQLVAATGHRLRKRQTGNEQSYSLLLEWFSEWQLDIKQLGIVGVSRVLDGILAFPVDENFQNKIFEIWCLQEVAKSLSRCGCELIQDIAPLHERSHRPIYEFILAGKKIQLWFQNSSILGKSRWKYAGERELAGIPDIIVHADGHTPMIIDAKYRELLTPTRSEETYKFLGYIENFRDVLGMNCQGILIFVSDTTRETRLIGPDNNQLAILSIDTELDTQLHFQEICDTFVGKWLSEIIASPLYALNS